MANVIFKQGTREQYNAIAVKDANTLYWLSDTKELYKGDVLYGTGAEATAAVAGLMSAEDKAKLDALVSGGISGLTAVDASVIIGTGDDATTIGVQISKVEGNILELKDDGLFVPPAAASDSVEFEIELQETPEDGYAATYKLKRTDSEGSTYVGDAINLPKDAVLTGGTYEIVKTKDEPYEGAEVGDPYVDLVVANAEESHIYIPLKGLVDTVKAGNGIAVVDNTISIKLNDGATNGLTVTEDGLALSVATPESSGAMSAADKKFVDTIPVVYGRVGYEATNMLPGARFDVNGKEIRVMFPSDAPFVKPEGEAAGRDNNRYYFGLRVFAPSDDVTGFKEADSETIPDGTPLEDFNGSSSGVDKYGRKYDVCWFPVAKYDDETGAWTYFGDASKPGEYVGWFHTIEWYKDSECVGSETVRINLTNKDCHNSLKTFLGKDNTSAALVWSDM